MNEEIKQLRAKQWGEEKAKEYYQEMERVFRPEAVGSLVVYLASEQADHVNCCVFEVWGGHVGIYRDPPEVEQVLWKDGVWSAEELVDLMPTTLTRGKVRELPPFALSL